MPEASKPRSILPPSLTGRKHRARIGESRPRFEVVAHQRESEAFLAAFKLARHYSPGLTCGALFGYLARSFGVQLRRRIRATGVDPESILAESGRGKRGGSIPERSAKPPQR